MNLRSLVMTIPIASEYHDTDILMKSESSVGDTVNTTSRMESSGEVAKVNISQATHDILMNDSDFTFESRGLIEAKGKGKMEMWFVKST